MQLPPMILVRQRFRSPAVVDVAQAVREGLVELRLSQVIRPGMKVGLPVGSRGIRDLTLIVREIVRYIYELGAEPVIVGAMGSHGGGTPEGQVQVLHSLGVSEEQVGAPVMGSVEADLIGMTASGWPVYFDRVLRSCDAVLVMNRVKPHTSFRGPVESGLVKMLVVGCGKPAGAEQFHQCHPTEASERLLEAVAVILDHISVVGGIAVLENALERTAAVVPVPVETLVETERDLLKQAKELLPGLPAKELDLLVVDEMGKNISGTGMDTNVIGRWGIPGMPEPDVRVRRLAVLDLTEASHGNANGMGLADFVTRRFRSKIDFAATYLNTITATFTERAKLPIVLESDRKVIETALQTVGRPANPRIVRIKNTLQLERVLVSPSVLADLRDVEIEEGPKPWPFDEQGNLPLKCASSRAIASHSQNAF